MAHFRAVIQGTRGQASRLGDKKNGIRSVVNGWTEGVTVEATHANGLDIFEVWSTGGSNGTHHRQFLGTLCEGTFRPALEMKS